MLCFYIFLWVQILCESFPISSSGHVQLAQKLLHTFGVSCGQFFNGSVTSLEIIEHYSHWPTLIILAVFFFNKWFFLLRNFSRCKKIILKIVGLGIIVDGLTCILYLFFRKFTLDSFPLTMGFIITALFLFSLLCIRTKKFNTLNLASAVALGLGQGIALLPGVSRFAITYVIARWFSISPRRSFDISWMLVFPLMVGAFLKSMLHIYKDAQLQALVFQFPVIITMLCAGLISYIAFCGVARMSYKNQLGWFAYYMIIPSILSLLI